MVVFHQVDAVACAITGKLATCLYIAVPAQLFAVTVKECYKQFLNVSANFLVYVIGRTMFGIMKGSLKSTKLFVQC